MRGLTSLILSAIPTVILFKLEHTGLASFIVCPIAFFFFYYIALKPKNSKPNNSKDSDNS
jgi:hypothetical protein